VPTREESGQAAQSAVTGILITDARREWSYHNRAAREIVGTRDAARVDGCYRDALRFAGNEPQKDDITSVIIKVDLKRCCSD